MPNSIVLFKNAADRNRVDKTAFLTQVAQLDGVFKSSVSLTSPQITIRYSDDVERSFFIECNYLFSSDLHRFYFINEIIYLANNTLSLILECDVLMSFRDSIANLEALIERNESVYNPDLFDKEVSLSNDRTTAYIRLGTSSIFKQTSSTATEDNICLTTIQGV